MKNLFLIPFFIIAFIEISVSYMQDDFCITKIQENITNFEASQYKD